MSVKRIRKARKLAATKPVSEQALCGTFKSPLKVPQISALARAALDNGVSFKSPLKVPQISALARAALDNGVSFEDVDAYLSHVNTLSRKGIEV